MEQRLADRMEQRLADGLIDGQQRLADGLAERIVDGQQRLADGLAERIERRVVRACMWFTAAAVMLFLVATGVLLFVHAAVPGASSTLDPVARPILARLPSPDLLYARSAMEHAAGHVMRLAGPGFLQLPAPDLQVPSLSWPTWGLWTARTRGTRAARRGSYLMARQRLRLQCPIRRSSAGSW